MEDNYTLGSICTSGGVYEQGLPKSIKPIWGVEFDHLVADVYRLNYPDSRIYVQDACTVNWQELEKPDFLHASPSCRSYSLANNKKETEKDIAVAQAIARAIATFKPKVFTLENVIKYSDSTSWLEVIKPKLESLGYKISAKVEKMHFWGIPQKRRYRFIAIATLDYGSIMLMPTNRTNYWYELIADLISELKPSQLTDTQIDHLPKKAARAIADKETVLLKRNQIRNYTGCAYQSEPYCWSPTAKLATDQSQNNRPFADLVTPNGIFSLTIRCLARIQTISDSYILPESNAIAGLVVGDGVPPLFVSQMWEQILAVLNKKTLLEQNVESNSNALLNNTESSAICGRFEQLEKVIKKCSGHDVSFYALAKALQEIKTEKLYQDAGYRSFFRYCSDRHNLQKTYVSDLLKAVPIYESVKDITSDLTESHCRELGKIEDESKRSQILQSLINSGDKITARSIAIENRKMVVESIAQKQKPKLPPLGAVVKLTTKLNPELKGFDSYWAIISKLNEFTCEASVLGASLLLSPQDFMIIESKNEFTLNYAKTLLDRLNTVYQSPLANRTIKNIAISFAKNPSLILEEADEYILFSIELYFKKILESDRVKVLFKK